MARARKARARLVGGGGNGRPVPPPGMTMTFTKVEDMTTGILDDSAETYTIADVVFLGD